MVSIGRAFRQGHDEAYPMHRRSWQQAKHFGNLEDMQRTDMQTPRDLQEIIGTVLQLQLHGVFACLDTKYLCTEETRVHFEFSKATSARTQS